MIGFVIFIMGQRVDVVLKPRKGETRQALNRRASNMALDIYRNRRGLPSSFSAIPERIVAVGQVKVNVGGSLSAEV